jgi:hypothetical protein
MELFWGCRYGYHLFVLGNGHREEPKITWLFYNTDMLLMLVVAAASVSLFYYLLLPHCGCTSHLLYLEQQCPERRCEAHTTLLCAG